MGSGSKPVEMVSMEGCAGSCQQPVFPELRCRRRALREHPWGQSFHFCHSRAVITQGPLAVSPRPYTGVLLDGHRSTRSDCLSSVPCVSCRRTGPMQSGQAAVHLPGWEVIPALTHSPGPTCHSGEPEHVRLKPLLSASQVIYGGGFFTRTD